MGPRILLVVGGGIAAYKACELVRLIRKGANGVPGEVTCVLTEGGSKFVTPMALAALSENPVHTTLWDLKNEVEMGHIQLSRQADLIVVCPATADLLAAIGQGTHDLEQLARRDRDLAVLGVVDRCTGHHLDFQIGAGQRQLAIPHLRQQVGQDRQGLPAFDHVDDLRQRLQQDFALQGEPHVDP